MTITMLPSPPLSPLQTVLHASARDLVEPELHRLAEELQRAYEDASRAWEQFDCHRNGDPGDEYEAERLSDVADERAELLVDSWAKGLVPIDRGTLAEARARLGRRPVVKQTSVVMDWPATDWPRGRGAE